MCGCGRTSAERSYCGGGGTGPAWARKTKGPTWRRFANGSTRRTWRPWPRSAARAVITISSIVFSFVSGLQGISRYSKSGRRRVLPRHPRNRLCRAARCAPWGVTPQAAQWVSQLAHPAALEIRERLVDFRLAVHHERSIAHHRFVDRFAGQPEQGGVGHGGERHALARAFV